MRYRTIYDAMKRIPTDSDCGAEPNAANAVFIEALRQFCCQLRVDIGISMDAYLDDRIDDLLSHAVEMYQTHLRCLCDYQNPTATHFIETIAHMVALELREAT